MKKLSLTLLITISGAAAPFAFAQELTVEDLAGSIRADEAYVRAHPDDGTAHAKAVRDWEERAAEEEARDRRERETARAAAENAAREAEAAKWRALPPDYAAAKAAMIKQFEIPDGAKIFSFNTFGTPVRWAAIAWETTGVTRVSGAGSGFGMHAVGPDQVSVQHLYHSRGYDFLNKTITDQSDY